MRRLPRASAAFSISSAWACDVGHVAVACEVFLCRELLANRAVLPHRSFVEDVEKGLTLFHIFRLGTVPELL